MTNLLSRIQTYNLWHGQSSVRLSYSKQLAQGKSYKYMFPQASHLDFECSLSCTTISTSLKSPKKSLFVTIKYCSQIFRKLSKNLSDFKAVNIVLRRFAWCRLLFLILLLAMIVSVGKCTCVLKLYLQTISISCN